MSRSYGDVCTSISVASELTISMQAALARVPVSTAFVVAAENEWAEPGGQPSQHD